MSAPLADQALATLRQVLDSQAEELRRAPGAAATKLNQAIRCLHAAESLSAWVRALLDGTEGWCSSAALLALANGKVKLEAVRNLSASAVEVELAAAPAIASAAQSPDPVVAVRTAGEFSGPLAAALGDGPGKAYLFPISNGQRVAAVLYAGGSVETSALELLAGYASLALELRIGRKSAEDIVTVQPAKGRPRWEDLPAAEQEIHRKAQRFANVKIAELRLYRSNEVKQARTSGNIYQTFQAEIDAAREQFRTAFTASSPTMVDYLHLELVRALANGDAALLGNAYPGPLSLPA